MAENFSIEHSRTKITEVKKTIEDKKQKLDELKQQKKSLMDAGLALDSSNLDSAVQATLMESINDSLRDVENKAYDVSKDGFHCGNPVPAIRNGENFVDFILCTVYYET